jgi:hypothetical protein
MATCDISLEIYAKCNECGKDLKCGLSVNYYKSNEITIDVEPCPNCIAEALEEGRKDNE